jgi:hypothetical protein
MRIFTIFKYGPSTAPTIQVLEPRFSVTVTGIGEPLLIHGPVSIVAGVATSKPHVVAVAVVVVVVIMIVVVVVVVVAGNSLIENVKPIDFKAPLC